MINMNKPILHFIYILLFFPFQSNAVFTHLDLPEVASWSSSAHQLDQESPSAVCVPTLKLQLLAFTGTYALNAYDLESGKSSDNQTAYKGLIFSFSKNIYDNRRLFDCNDVGEKTIELWVTDEAGNQSYCSATIHITDPHDTCGLTKRSSTLS